MADNIRIWAGMAFICVPKGVFVMGSKDDNELAWEDEKPQHSLEIPYDYWVGKLPIRNLQFADFARSKPYKTRAEQEGWCWVWNPHDEQWEKIEGANWQHPLGGNSGIIDIAEHPVVQVCWYDALAYCEWLNQRHRNELPQGYHFRLPSEAEWEKAARGTQGREWPWGNDFDATLCNSRESGKLATVTSGAHSPQGDSEYGVADMGGNIWEWTTTLWGNDRNTPTYVYPYLRDDGRENLLAGDGHYRIIRGGSFKDTLQGVRSACRDLDPPNYSLNNLGFRVFIAP